MGEHDVMWLEQTDKVFRIGFEPPLTEDELKALAPPARRHRGGVGHWDVQGIPRPDGTMTVSFPKPAFGYKEDEFIDYATRQNEELLGHYVLDSEVLLVEEADK